MLAFVGYSVGKSTETSACVRNCRGPEGRLLEIILAAFARVLAEKGGAGGGVGVARSA